MDRLDDDSLRTILSKVKIETSIRYVPYGDGEQNYTIFYKNVYPYTLVNKYWNKRFTYQMSKL